MASKNRDKEHREPRVRESREPPSLLPFFSLPRVIRHKIIEKYLPCSFQ